MHHRYTMKRRKQTRSKRRRLKGGKQKTMKVDGDALGWRPRVRVNNINKLLLKSHKNGMTKLVITNFWREGRCLHRK